MQLAPISADLAIDLYEALLSARQLQLQPALSAAVRIVGVQGIDADLQRLVPAPALNQVASLGLRGELVFPVPAIILHSPPLIGYYRMLLGLSQKEFGGRLGYSGWVAAEKSGRLRPDLTDELDSFCSALITPLTQLVDAMGAFDGRDLNDLALLTLGPTLQGGRNNLKGSRAALEVFQSLRSIVAPWLTLDKAALLRFTTSAGRTFEAVRAPDPDIRVSEGVGSGSTPLLAIEIKGGSDASNAHNRAGEAEKSHIKAKIAGYIHRWTVIRMGGVDRQRIQSETPSSTAVFEAEAIIKRDGVDWEEFQENLSRLIGPVA
jgi:hypothetical protein